MKQVKEIFIKREVFSACGPMSFDILQVSRM